MISGLQLFSKQHLLRAGCCRWPSISRILSGQKVKAIALERPLLHYVQRSGGDGRETDGRTETRYTMSQKMSPDELLKAVWEPLGDQEQPALHLVRPDGRGRSSEPD